MSGATTTEATASTFVYAPQGGAPIAPLRVSLRDGGAWFVARDICRALGMDPRKARKAFAGEEVISLRVRGAPGGAALAVNEYGAFALIRKSLRPEAQALGEWLARAVLPSGDRGIQ